MNKNLDDEIIQYSTKTIETICKELKTNLCGLTSEEVKNRQNASSKSQGNNLRYRVIFKSLFHSFTNPFSIVLLIIITISFVTDVLLKAPNNRNYLIIIVMTIMFLLSGFIRFSQEMHSKRVFDSLMKVVDVKVSTLRDKKWQLIGIDDLVVGDIVKLVSGEQVPADIRLIKTNNCFVSQANITGESESVFKDGLVNAIKPNKISDCHNLVFAKSNIIGGNCEGIVIATGEDVFYGAINAIIDQKRRGFDEGSNSIAFVLLRFMVMIVPIVFVVAGFSQGNWLTAILFAMSVSIGLTPELLPMVITACLAKGSHSMGQKQTIVKNVNAMQAFGEMDVLCVDKTGTLTNDELNLEYYTDILGNESQKALDYAYLNSYFRGGVANHVDNAILKVKSMPNSNFESLIEGYSKIADCPFDYEKKYSSVTLFKDHRYLLIAKGSINDIVNHCKYFEFHNELYELGEEPLNNVNKIVDEMREDGMKVIAIAYKENEKLFKDNEDLILLGYIAFFDAPKQSAISAIQKLKKLNIDIKVLTGDNFKTTKSICRRLNMNDGLIITGAELDLLNDDEFQLSAEKYDIFVELSPRQKARIIELLKSNGHHVGFLGDGLNDIPAFLESDVAISVDNALPAVKENADVILLKKDLNVLENGVIEGRKAFANMMKYVKITSSSNLGNIISIIFASLFLPFFPMASIQILLLNLLYDILCLVLPWDNVEDNQIKKSLEWSGNKLSEFMLFFGPISSLFDLVTFGFLFFVFCPFIAGGTFASLTASQQIYFIALFQTGWFLESMWSQVLILFSLRTNELKIFKHAPSKKMMIVTLLGISIFTLIVMTPFGELIGLTKIPFNYFIFLTIVVAIYLLVVTVAKRYYIKRYGNLI